MINHLIRVRLDPGTNLIEVYFNSLRQFPGGRYVDLESRILIKMVSSLAPCGLAVLKKINSLTLTQTEANTFTVRGETSAQTNTRNFHPSSFLASLLTQYISMQGQIIIIQ